MDYCKYTREQPLETIPAINMLKKESVAEEEQGKMLDLAWSRLKFEKKKGILEQESTADALTGILNRRAIMIELESKIDKALKYKSPLSIVMLNIDNFKNVNDTKGYNFRDKVIKQIARTISDCIRGLDSVGKYSSEEFLAIFPNSNKFNALSVCERIQEKIENFYFDEGFKVTISAGIVEYDNEEITEFIDEAYKKLYAAKNLGGNRIEA